MISIAGAAFVSIFIAFICYCCKRKAPKNNTHESTQSDKLIPEQQDEFNQYPAYPSME